MYSPVETADWFKRRNLVLGAGFPESGTTQRLPRSVEAYLLVTLALRPHTLPEDVVAYLASRFFADRVH